MKPAPRNIQDPALQTNHRGGGDEREPGRSARSFGPGMDGSCLTGTRELPASKLRPEMRPSGSGPDQWPRAREALRSERGIQVLFSVSSQSSSRAGGALSSRAGGALSNRAGGALSRRAGGALSTRRQSSPAPLRLRVVSVAVVRACRCDTCRPVRACLGHDNPVDGCKGGKARRVRTWPDARGSHSSPGSADVPESPASGGSRGPA